MAPDGGSRIHPGKRAKHKGRGKGPPFLQLYFRMTDSDEFGKLSGHGVKLLLELARQYRPGRNGDLSIPWSLLKARGWRSQGTVADAKRELLEGGWIIETRKGGRNLPSLYAITWQPIDESEKHWEPATTTAPDTWQKREC